MNDNVDCKEINTFENKNILVTGGCGSIGSEIVKQLLYLKPKTIRVLDNSESGHFYLKQTLQHLNGAEKVRYLLGDIRDKDRLMRAMREIDIVFHAAALKHVDLCEYNPFEAVNTNVIGTKNIIDVAIIQGVNRIISISTDKAVNPINTMGATKLLSEKLITNTPVGPQMPLFSCVRFGNVLDSVGSVIPIFNKKIQENNYITI